MGNELRMGRIITMHPLEEVARLRRLRKGCSPDGLSEGFSIVSAAVGSSPFALDLQSGQGPAILRHSDRNDSQQDNQDLHFQDNFQPQGDNLY